MGRQRKLYRQWTKQEVEQVSRKEGDQWVRQASCGDDRRKRTSEVKSKKNENLGEILWDRALDVLIREIEEAASVGSEGGRRAEGPTLGARSLDEALSAA